MIFYFLNSIRIRFSRICILSSILPASLLAQPDTLIIDREALSWTGVLGATYEIWYSTDLVVFHNSGITRTGRGKLTFDVSDILPAPLPEKAFFQLRWNEFVDSDGDLIDDAYEQLLVDANPSDTITTIQQFLPEHDFDNDGIKNYDEYRYSLDPQADDTTLASATLTYSYQLNRLISLTALDGSRATFVYDKNQNILSVGQ